MIFFPTLANNARVGAKEANASACELSYCGT